MKAFMLSKNAALIQRCMRSDKIILIIDMEE